VANFCNVMEPSGRYEVPIRNFWREVPAESPRSARRVPQIALAQARHLVASTALASLQNGHVFVGGGAGSRRNACVMR